MNNAKKGALLTAFGGMCWGLSGSVGQYMFQNLGMSSQWLVPIRLGLAGIVLLIWNFAIYGWRKTVSPWTSRKDAFMLLFYGLAGVTLCQYTYFLTIQYSNAGIATIMQSLAPVPILLITCLRAHRKPTLNQLLCVILALAGIFVLTTHGNPKELIVPGRAVLSGLVSAATVVIYNMASEPLVKKFPVSLMQGWSFLLGGILIGCIFQSWKIDYTPDWRGLLGIGIVVLVGNVLAFTTYISGVALIGPQKGNLFGFAEPITAALLTTLVLGTPFTWWDALGFILIFSMLMLLTVSQSKETS